MNAPTSASRLILRASTAMIAGLVLCQCTSSTPIQADRVVVSVEDQKIGLYQNGELKKRYKVSTSKFGLGSQPGSYKTPVGKHEIVSKIGEGLPAGAVLKGREWNGEVLSRDAPGRDPVVSRILWLRGKEACNENTYNRLIYIHGTPEERNLGQPASYGCIRMGMKDVISVFAQVPVGTTVEITEARLNRHDAAQTLGAE